MSMLRCLYDLITCLQTFNNMDDFDDHRNIFDIDIKKNQ